MCQNQLFLTHDLELPSGAGLRNNLLFRFYSFPNLTLVPWISNRTHASLKQSTNYKYWRRNWQKFCFRNVYCVLCILDIWCILECSSVFLDFSACLSVFKMLHTLRPFGWGAKLSFYSGRFHPIALLWPCKLLIGCIAAICHLTILSRLPLAIFAIRPADEKSKYYCNCLISANPTSR